MSNDSALNRVSAPSPSEVAFASERDFMLCMNPAQGDVPVAERQAAAQWAGVWMGAEPDAFVLIGCNDRARNRDERTRQVRLRRLAGALRKQGVPAERIRCTTTAVVTPLCSQVGERGVAWLKVMRPEQLEIGVMPINFLFASEACELCRAA